MLNPNAHNSQTSSPDSRINNQEFNEVALKFGSFLSMSQNKCLNHVNTLSIIMKSSLIKTIFIKLIGSDNIYELIQLYIDNTPNLYKKVAKRILFR